MQKFSRGFFSVLDPTVKFINFIIEKFFSKNETVILNITDKSNNKSLRIININCEEIGQ